jgi:methionyl-tRNA synthetase
MLAEPHMGGAYSTIAADVLARYQRARGKRVTFVTGTDEHGEKIALSAEAAGRSPQEHCDRIAALYQQLWLQVRRGAPPVATRAGGATV